MRMMKHPKEEEKKKKKKVLQLKMKAKKKSKNIGTAQHSTALHRCTAIFHLLIRGLCWFFLFGLVTVMVCSLRRLEKESHECHECVV